MNRKSIFKLFGIIALVALIGFSMMACASLNTSTPSTPRGPQTTVTVTGIPSEYNGMFAFITVDIPNRHDGWNMATISGGSATFPLLDWRDDKPYSVSGDYMVIIFIFTDRSNFRNSSVYDGYIMSKRIQENTTIVWSEFIIAP